jgi:hypothetical protein
MALLTTKQAAEYLCVSMAFLERDRWAGEKVPFVRVGSRAVRYLRTDLEDFAASRRVLSEKNVQGNQDPTSAISGHSPD